MLWNLERINKIIKHFLTVYDTTFLSVGIDVVGQVDLKVQGDMLNTNYRPLFTVVVHSILIQHMPKKGLLAEHLL